jgi:DNA-binding NarL/FixJ family response regulator
MKRLVIVADHTCVVETIRLVLRQTAGFHVAGVIDGRNSARGAIAEARPDIVLVDDMQIPENALARMREIDDDAPDAKIVLLTLRLDPEWVSEAFGAGADAVISKAVHPVSLATLLRETANGNVFHSPAVTTGASQAGQDCPLTARELEILRLVAEGYTNGRIARGLWVTEQTVKFHLSNIYRKLGVANRTEASRYAHVHSLLDQRAQLAAAS